MHTCPRCGLTNPDTAIWCDCGYDFRSGQMRAQPATAMSDGAETPKGIGGVVDRLRYHAEPGSYSPYGGIGRTD
jgi:hypothetical protein